jgi:hypothetical protein
MRRAEFMGRENQFASAKELQVHHLSKNTN